MAIDGRGRLFTAGVDRLRATYTFTSRAFLRAIGQYVSIRRDPAATPRRSRKDASFGGSALFAYKLNWQTVLFVGYGDDRELDDAGGHLSRVDRQFFVKLLRVPAVGAEEPGRPPVVRVTCVTARPLVVSFIHWRTGGRQGYDRSGQRDDTRQSAEQ